MGNVGLTASARPTDIPRWPQKQSAATIDSEPHSVNPPKTFSE
jgi:hypothetical protein